MTFFKTGKEKVGRKERKGFAGIVETFYFSVLKKEKIVGMDSDGKIAGRERRAKIIQ